MLNVNNINQYYGGSHILRDVSLQTQMGKVTVLLGRNGVGKTTLLKSLMGVVPVKAGGARFDVANLQAHCVTCHNRKTAQETARKR